MARDHDRGGRRDMSDLLTRYAATISPCGLYRYSLERWWGEGPRLLVVMLNPSKADATINDPTIGRIVGFAEREKMAGATVCNIFAYRATDPADMARARDPIGPENDDYLKAMADHAAGAGLPILCAWGAHKMAKARSRDVAAMMRARGARLVCLATSQSGAPVHPLYQRREAPFLEYQEAL